MKKHLSSFPQVFDNFPLRPAYGYFANLLNKKFHDFPKNVLKQMYIGGNLFQFTSQKVDF